MRRTPKFLPFDRFGFIPLHNSDGDGGPGRGQSSESGAGQGAQGGETGEGQDGKTFTQADLDRIVSDRLSRERSKYSDYEQVKAKASELDELKESQASETEKALKNAQSEAEKAVRAELEPQMLKLQAAIEHGLPEEMAKRVLSAAKRLVGATADELAADAKEFFAAAPIAAEPKPPSFDQGPRGTTKAPPSVAAGAELYAQRNKKT